MSAGRSLKKSSDKRRKACYNKKDSEKDSKKEGESHATL